MSELTAEQFWQFLQEAIDKAIEVAQPHVAELLPRTVRLHLEGYGHGQPRPEPTREELMAALYRDGTFPQQIDVSVAGIEDDTTLIGLSTESWVSGNPPRVGPFIISGLPLPGEIWLRPRPLSRTDLIDLAASNRATWQAQDAVPPGSIADERRRLWRGPSLDELSRVPSTDQMVVRCPGDAPAVLDRARQVLDGILAQAAAGWPSDEEWRRILPAWFVAACAEERLGEDIDPWQAELRDVLPDEWKRWLREHPRKRPIRPQPPDSEPRWTVGGFIYWFEPEERQWWWWDATVQDADTVMVEVVPYDEPYAAGALMWLFKAAGALSVEPAAGMS